MLKDEDGDAMNAMGWRVEMLLWDVKVRKLLELS